jgi:hypothetical protein
MAAHDDIHEDLGRGFPFDMEPPDAGYRTGDDTTGPPDESVGGAGLGPAPYADDVELLGDSLVMGPSGVGKTTMIAAMDQACNYANPSRTRPDLEFIGGPETAALTSRAVQQILEHETIIEHTLEAAQYEFMVAVRGKAGAGPTEQAHFAFVDGPGGALFPTSRDMLDPALLDWEVELLRRGQAAKGIVMCLDPNDQEHCALTHRYTASLLAKLMDPLNPPWWPINEVSPWYVRLRDWFGLGEPERREQKILRLRARRFLLLLTKVDLYASALLASMHPDDARGCTPQQLAGQLDPVAQAAELLGDVVLRRILSALGPDAQFAIGFSSNWGFDPESGEPFMPDGRTTRGLHGMSCHRRPADWQPFGVREAIDFMVTGVASGPIRLVDHESLAPARRKRAYASPLRPAWGR